MRRVILCSVMFLSVFGLALAQKGTRPVLMVLPFTSSGVDSQTVRAALNVLRAEINRDGEFYYALSEAVSARTSCGDLFCALKSGRKNGAAGVIFGHVAAQGSKLIMTFKVADVEAEEQVVVEEISVSSADDLSEAMRELAMRFKFGDDFISIGDWGGVPKTRARVIFLSGAIGKFLPQREYPGLGEQSIGEFHFGMTSSSMELSVYAGWRSGLAAGIEMKGSVPAWVSPYASLALGYHSVTLEGDEADRDSGFELGLRAGISLFHNSVVRPFFDCSVTFLAVPTEGEISESGPREAIVVTAGAAVVLSDPF